MNSASTGTTVTTLFEVSLPPGAHFRGARDGRFVFVGPDRRQQTFTGVGRRFAGGEEHFAGPARDGARFAVAVGEVRELQRHRADVRDDHLVVDRLADLALQFRGRVARRAALDFLELLDREAVLALEVDVMVESAADAVGFPGRVGVDDRLAFDLGDRDRVRPRRPIEDQGVGRDDFFVDLDDLGDGVVFRVGEAFEAEPDVGAGEFGFADALARIGMGHRRAEREHRQQSAERTCHQHARQERCSVVASSYPVRPTSEPPCLGMSRRGPRQAQPSLGPRYRTNRRNVSPPAPHSRTDPG